MIPSFTKSASNLERLAHAQAEKEINSILLSSCDGLLAADRKEQLQVIKQSHSIEREGGACHECQLRLKHWPERAQLNTMDPLKTTLDHFWSAGAGLRFDVCGYNKSNSALFHLRHLPYFEFYERTTDGHVLNDSIQFKDTRNPIKIADPLLDQLSAVNGCKISTMEVIMIFYQADAKMRRRIISKLEAAKAKGIKQSEADEDQICKSCR